MSVVKAVGYIPELKFGTSYKQRIKLTESLYLLPLSDTIARDFKVSIEAGGHKLTEGSFLYYEGTLRQDGTVYEVFQGYALALSFFSPKGRASCRALKELDTESEIELFIDEHDRFGYETEDVITVIKKNIVIIENIYKRVEAQLVAKSFNTLRNSLEFFILFLEERKIRTRLLYLSISLESILLEGESEGLAYKLGMRGSNLLNAYYKEVDMFKIFTELKNSYDLRSAIIHGNDYKKMSDKVNGKRGKTSTELDHILVLEVIVKDILSLVFGTEDLYNLSIKSQLGKTIDQKHILDQKIS
jgi:hypothetical protein